jgi:hypothetical protein
MLSQKDGAMEEEDDSTERCDAGLERASDEWVDGFVAGDLEVWGLVECEPR